MRFDVIYSSLQAILDSIKFSKIEVVPQNETLVA